jgi:DNA-directed RNA polymerase specialized sigma24 family protein
VLHLRYVQNKSDADIAVEFNVHRTSVVRWLSHARKVLSQHTRRALPMAGRAFEQRDVLLSYFVL